MKQSGGLWEGERSAGWEQLEHCGRKVIPQSADTGGEGLKAPARWKEIKQMPCLCVESLQMLVALLRQYEL